MADKLEILALDERGKAKIRYTDDDGTVVKYTTTVPLDKTTEEDVIDFLANTVPLPDLEKERTKKNADDPFFLIRDNLRAKPIDVTNKMQTRKGN